MIITDNNKYLYSLYDLFVISYTSNIFENEINHKNFSAIVLDNISVITNTQKHITEKYPHILNIY